MIQKILFFFFFIFSIIFTGCTTITEDEKNVKPVDSVEIENKTKPSSAFFIKSEKASVQGTSTLHNWRSKITKMECTGSFVSLNDTLKSISDVELKILVEGIKSKDGMEMDNEVYRAFKSDKNPYIIYKMDSAEINPDSAGIFRINVFGDLSMAGTTNPVSLKADGRLLPNGDLQLKLSKKLKMSEYNMKPDAVFFGAIKAGDEIGVNFDLVLSHFN